MKMQDFNFSVKFMKVLRQVIQEEMDKRHNIRIAIVVSWDRTARTCQIYFPEAPDNIVTVNMGAYQPRIAGQKVRVERFKNDWFLTDMLDQGGYYYTTF